jgi:hypothetical protein
MFKLNCTDHLKVGFQGLENFLDRVKRKHNLALPFTTTEVLVGLKSVNINNISYRTEELITHLDSSYLTGNIGEICVEIVCHP